MIHLVQADATKLPLADQSVHCVVTSPPYFSLRDYGTGTWEGGSADCDHKQELPRFNGPKQTQAQVSGHASNAERNGRRTCQKCGATRIDLQIGLEKTPDEFVAKMVQVFREVWRVLRDDGTLWLNLGDSYTSGNRVGHGTRVGNKQETNAGCLSTGDRRPSVPDGLKPKDLIGIPWMLAFALRADGWYLRSDIVWAKPNGMTESVTDRPTRSHEFIFLLTKKPRYFYDSFAIREPTTAKSKSAGRNSRAYPNHPAARKNRQPLGRSGVEQNPPWDGGEFRNKRSVWTVAVHPFKGAHFAVFPQKLITPCILAGTSEKGCCPQCGAQWKRIVERKRVATRPGVDTKTSGLNGSVIGNRDPQRHCTTTKTVGWQPGCACGREPVPCTVLDPFSGAGTTALVCKWLGRSAIGVELSADYIRMAQDRIARNGERPKAKDAKEELLLF